MTSRRTFLALALPSLLLVAVEIAPLVSGAKTLYLRDVLNSHLPMRASLQRALQEDGVPPLVDRWRAGGQPLLGNPNVSALYPDSWLLRFLPLLWVHNLRFWLHWLLAPFALAWLGRSLGLRPAGAWAAGIAFALSGYFISQLNFHNAVAGVALAPALVAAAVRLAEVAATDRRGVRRLWVATAGLGGLLLVSGEPFVALMAAGLAIAAVFTRLGWAALRPRVVARGGLAALAALALAAPQLVELARILGASYRGLQGYSTNSSTVASFDPRQVVEWFVPFVFGRPDRPGLGGFWGQEYFTGTPAYYFTLYPGLLVLALCAVGLTQGRRPPRGPGNGLRRFSVGAIGAGLFLSLGRFNPLLVGALGLGGAAGEGSVLRYPIRFWLPLAIGAALLAGRGFEAVFDAEPADFADSTSVVAGSRRLRRAVEILGGTFLVAWLALSLGGASVERWIASLVPASLPVTDVAHNERLRWAGLCLFSIGVLAAARLVLVLGDRRPRLAAPLLLVLHTASQLFFLRPAIPQDDAAPYQTPSAWLARLAADGPARRTEDFGLTVHGSFGALFGKAGSSISDAVFPDPRGLWLERRAFLDAYPFAGVVHGRRYELNVAPEHLDSYLTMLGRGAVLSAKNDSERIRLLRAWGVDRLLLGRALDESALASTLVHEIGRQTLFERTTILYALEGPAGRVAVARRMLGAPTADAAIDAMRDPAFDPRQVVVVAGDAVDQRGPAGRARIVAESSDGMEIEVVVEATGASEPGGDGGAAARPVLVVQRAWQPFYRVSVDGREVPVLVANLHRIGVELPAGGGSFRVRLEADRRPTRRAFAVALAALALVLVVAALDSGRGHRRSGAAGKVPTLR